MPIRDCAVIAIDGTHASGKTTLIHAMTAHYWRRGINVAAMSEPARSSPFMEEIVIHQRGSFDLAAEVDVFATHLQYQLRTARNHQLLITDKTIVNVLAYARMLLNIEPNTIDAAVLDAMEIFCRARAPTTTSYSSPTTTTASPATASAPRSLACNTPPPPPCASSTRSSTLPCSAFPSGTRPASESSGSPRGSPPGA